MISRLSSVAPLIAVSVLVALSGRPVAAQIGPSQTQTVQSRSFEMPLGAQPATVPQTQRVAPRPRVPIGDEALEQIKRQAPISPRTEAPTPPRPQAQPQAPLTTCQTNSEVDSTPSDIIGAVGPTNLVVATNSEFNVYNKSNCALVASTQIDTLFNAGTGEGYFDPQVLWDNANGRFIVTAESTFSQTGNMDQNESFAVSKDSSGTSWWVYKIQIINGTNTFCVSANTTFWDYPHVGSVNGTNPTWLIIANVFPAAGGSNANVITFPKTPTLTGAAITTTCFAGLQSNTAPPNVLDSNTIGYILSVGSGSGSAVLRYAFNTVAGTIGAPTSITIPAWTAPNPAAQPNGITLDALDGRFVAQTIQNGTNLWNIHSVASGGFAIGRLYQLSTTATTPLFTKDLFTASNDNIFNVSVATNSTQAFVSASRTIPSVPTTGNAAMLTFRGHNSANLGWTFDLVATSASEYTGGSDCNPDPFCRWGDNSSAQIDPSNNYRAWAFNQLITGPSQFQWTTNAALEGLPGVNTHDYNGNLDSDIAWRDTSGNTAIWLMNGTTVTNQNTSFVANVGTQWSIVGQRDFNGDGFADLLWRDTSGNVAIWEMNGTSVLNQNSAFVANVPTPQWSILGTGDFNGDGLGDILWQDSSGNVAIWEMNGTTILNQNSSFVANVPSQWSIKGTGDFNGDGKADILWQDSSGNVAIWEMNGTTILNQNSSFVANVPGQWTIKGTGDFNADGKSDILWQDSSGNVAIWEMNGTTILNPNSSFVANVPGQWSLLLTGDFNGDGMSDILWQDTSHNVAIWEMNGTAVTNANSSFVANVPGQWSIQHLAAD
jgi:hypothetical protein